jgi:biopolymer transport protein ExbB
MDFFTEASKFYFEGGFFMHPIALCSVLALGLLIERFFYLVLRYNVNGDAFMRQIEKLVLANNIDRAIKLCNAEPTAALPRIVKAGLTRANKGEADIISAIEEEQLTVTPLLTKRTNTLAAVGNLATLLGLLGTIQGLIQAFAGLANAAPDQRSQYLSNAIAVALNTTAFGLGVGIPCVAGHVFLTNVTKKIIDEIDVYSLKLQNLLFARARGELKAVPQAAAGATT